MTLPASPPITKLQIYTEFAVPLNTPFTQLVRGGLYVPNTPANAAIPTAPPLSMLQFLGASAQPPIDFQNATCSAGALAPNDATATLNINAGGTVTRGINNGAPQTLYTWLLSGAASAWEVVATLQSGNTNLGTYGTPLNLGSGRSWGCFFGGNSGSQSATVLIQVRPAGGGAFVDSCTFSLDATVES